MSKTTRIVALSLALVLCASLAVYGLVNGFSDKKQTDPALAETAQGASATGSPDDVLATVNGKQVKRSDMQSIYDDMASQYESYGYDTDESSLKTQALQSAVQYELWNQKLAENGFDKFTAEEEAELQKEAQTEWDSYVEDYTSSLLTSETPTDQEKADAKLQAETEMGQMGYTLEGLVDSLKSQKEWERMAAFLIKDMPTFTDQEIQDAYQAKVDADKESYGSDVGQYEYMTSYYGETAWYVPEGMRGVLHILLNVDSDLMDKYTSIQAQLEEQDEGTEAEAEEDTDAVDIDATDAPQATAEATATPVPVTQADLDAAKTAILASVKTTTDEIYAKLQSGASFASLVEEYGQDPGMKEDPAKSDGYSVHQDSVLYDPAFVEAAFSPEMQKIGDYSQPVVSSVGVHILYYLRDVPGGAVALTDEMKTSLLTDMEEDRKNDAVSTAMDEWVDSADIVYTNPEDAPESNG